MNQLKRLNDLDKWIRELTSIYMRETVGENSILSMPEGMYKKQLTDIDRFMFSFGELFQLSKEKERLLGFCEEWRDELLKDLMFLESSEWEELNKRLKRYEQRKISNGVFLTAETYFEWCFCCWVFYSEIRLFVISKNEIENNEVLKVPKNNENLILCCKLSNSHSFIKEFKLRYNQSQKQGCEKKNQEQIFDELKAIMKDDPYGLSIAHTTFESVKSTLSTRNKVKTE